MIEHLRQIAALQPQYDPANTPAMRERGAVLRGPLVNAVRDLEPELSAAMGEFGADFRVDASDGIGRKTEAPWLRFSSLHMSPNPRTGFYSVIHFSADGSAFWVTVGCGSTVWSGSDLQALPDAELKRRTKWARSVIERRFGSTTPLTDQIALGAKASLPRTFEKATVVAQRFDAGTAEEIDVVDALLRAAEFLAEIYRAQTTGAHLTPADAAELDIEALARPNRNASANQGFGLTGPERRAIELRAMDVARQWLEALGYAARDVSGNSPFDYEAVRDGETLKIEVKGTTAPTCAAFLMTRNEVELHRAEAGSTGLALVSGIELVRTPDGECSASGGECVGKIGWQIGECHLEPIAYRITLPAS